MERPVGDLAAVQVGEEAGGRHEDDEGEVQEPEELRDLQELRSDAAALASDDEGLRERVIGLAREHHRSQQREHDRHGREQEPSERMSPVTEPPELMQRHGPGLARPAMPCPSVLPGRRPRPWTPRAHASDPGRMR
jgi:hypothetical protein